MTEVGGLGTGTFVLALLTYLMSRVGREIYAAEWRSQPEGRISHAVDKQRREHNHVIPADSLYRLRIPNPIVNRRPGDLFMR